MIRTQLFFLAAAIITTAITSSGCIAQSGSATRQAVPTRTNDMSFKLPADAKAGLLDPKQAKFEAPKQFFAEFQTTQGNFVMEINRDWAPNGVDRFYSMIKVGFFNKTAIFRARKGFMFQFGIHGVPEVAKAWSKSKIKDDAYAGKSNVEGTIAFAQTTDPNSRSSQMFINLGDNGQSLDRGKNGKAGFYPFGQIIKGKDVIKKINTEYGENDRSVQSRFIYGGNAYIQERFPNLDYIKQVKIVQDPRVAGGMNTPTAAPVESGSGSR